MATRLDSLEAAALTARERRVVGRLLASLRDELGDDLLALWLYGSRARGEADLSATDPDRRSDIDLMAIVDPSRGWSPYGEQTLPLVTAAAEAEGDSPVWYSVLVYEPDYLQNRRKIRSFFIQDVDRDKIVLHGAASNEPSL
jgi:predicted nucleotidyltransferase